MFKKILPGLLVIPLLIACAAEEEHLPPGTQLMLNPNLSLYTDSVFPWTVSPFAGAKTGASTEVFMTGNRSLFIEIPDSLKYTSGSWRQTYTGPMPVQGSSLELMVFLKGENLRIVEGSTASLLITFSVDFRGYTHEKTSVRSVSSDIASKLQGDFDWTPIRLTLDNFPANANSISVNLGMLSLTTGKVYFDEITLTVL